VSEKLAAGSLRRKDMDTLCQFRPAFRLPLFWHPTYPSFRVYCNSSADHLRRLSLNGPRSFDWVPTDSGVFNLHIKPILTNQVYSDKSLAFSTPKASQHLFPFPLLSFLRKALVTGFIGSFQSFKPVPQQNICLRLPSFRALDLP
jgi:hypothetical protein